MTDSSDFDAEKIMAMDFISTYAKKFGLADKNLHGDNTYLFSEIAARKRLICQGIRELFLRGLLSLDSQKAGFYFQLTNIGHEISRAISGQYAIEYKRYAKLTIERYSELSGVELIRLIESGATGSDGDRT